MALGGGTFVTQNKNLPGSYINFVSASAASAILSDRGVAAFPIVLPWGEDGKVFTVTAEDFHKHSLRIFGYSYNANEMKGIRDLFLNLNTCHFYKLNSGGVKASSLYGIAKHPGERGNVIMVAISANEASTSENPKWDVETFFDGVQVDEQKGVSNASELKDNDYIVWADDATLTATSGTYFVGGTNGDTLAANYQAFLDAIESYSFNTIGTTSTEESIKELFATWTARMRNEAGVKFQCVLYRYSGADFEGVISVENKLVGETEGEDSTESGSLVYWVVGAQAGCEVSKSLTNTIYNGEYEIDVAYTQLQLEDAIKSGKFIFHRVNDTVRVLDDINTFVSFTDDKNADFSSNQTIRVLDQIGNDMASIFNDKYLGKVPNDAAGRISLWNDFVKHHQELERIRAIENFEPDNLTVTNDGNRKAVVVTDYITPVNCMAQLYMTIIVE